MKKLRFLAKLLPILLLLFAAVTIGAIAADADTITAKVGGVGYTSLEDAIAAASEGDTVYVTADTTLDRTEIAKSITLTSSGSGRYTVTLTDKTTVSDTSGLDGLPMVGVVAPTTAPEMITVAEGAVLNLKNIVLDASEASNRPMTVYGTLGIAGSVEIIGNESGEVLLASADSLHLTDNFTGAITVDVDGLTEASGVVFGVADGAYTGYSKISSAEDASLTAAIADGKLVWSNAVAQVGSAKYTSLSEAVASAGVGGTVTLLSDVTLSTTLTIAADKNLTLDLAGYTVSFSSASESVAVENRGKLTVTDTSTAGTGTITYEYTGADASAAVYNYGALTVSGGTVENTSSVANAYAIVNDNAEGDATLAVEDATVSSASASAVYVSATSADAKNSVALSSGTFTGATSAVAITGDATALDVAVSGGTYETASGSSDIVSDAQIEGVVTGGSFSTGVDSTLANTDCVVFEEDDGTITVRPNVAKTQNAAGEWVYYTNLEEAISAAVAGGTVYVLKDTTLTQISITKAVTIASESEDGTVFTVTYAPRSYVTGTGGTTGLPIIGVGGAETLYGLITVKGVGALTLENITIDASALDLPAIHLKGELTMSAGATVISTALTEGNGIGVKAEGYSVFNFFGGKLTGCSDYGAYIYDGATVNVKGGAVAADADAANVYLETTESLVLAGNFVGNIGITLKDVTVEDGTVFGSVSDASYTGASYFYADGAKGDFISAVNEASQLVFTAPSGEVLMYMNLCLDGQLGVKLYYDLTAVLADGSFDENTVLAFYIGDALIDSMTVGEAILDTDGLYIFECKVNASQMADTIDFRFENDGEVVGTAQSTSVRAYANYILSADNATLGIDAATYVAIQKLVRAMLNYGAMTQLQMGYNTDNLANADVDVSDFQDAPDITDTEAWFEYTNNESCELQFTDVSVGLGSTTSIRFYFTSSDVSRYTFYSLYIEEFDNGSMYLIETPLSVYTSKDESGYFIEVTNIPACYLDHAYRIEVRDASGQAIAVEATVLTYVRAQLATTTDEATIALMKAIYYYNQAANEYFGY